MKKHGSAEVYVRFKFAHGSNLLKLSTLESGVRSFGEEKMSVGVQQGGGGGGERRLRRWFR